MTTSRFLKNKELFTWLPYLAAGLGAILYLIQAVNYAHTTVSSLDEGSYLIKGIFYLNGAYHPFEPYGPLTNKAPFAFLIPGMAEYLFGAGLRTGRYVSIFFGLLTLLGTWVTARRWTGNWLAALTVWVFTLSPMIVKLHARAVSEVIIACMLAWICALALDEKASLWRVIIASILAAVAIFTRQNMVPLISFLVIYIFWQNGKRAGIWAFASGSIALIVFHLIYWPRVMTIWTPWLPESLTPFLDSFRIPTDSVPIWDPSIDVWNRLNAFFQGIRYHFIPIVGSFFGLILLPPRTNWKSGPAMRAAVFLSVSFFSLVLMHGWAALASKYESYSCVFCFSNYLGFFDPLGILFFILAFKYAWNDNPNRIVKILSIFSAILVATGIGYSLFEFVGNGILNLHVIPRPRPGGLGFIAIVDALTQGLNMSLVAVKRWVGSALGLLAGLGITLLTVLFSKSKPSKNFTTVLVNSFLATGIVLSPILHLGESRPDCPGTDIIRDHEELGTFLASVIPPDSLVYWDGGNAFTPMIYVPKARIFPPQINDGYTFHIGGDPDVLYYFSHWNSELSDRWRAEADIFVIEAKRYADWKNFLTPVEFQEFEKPPVSQSCNEGAELRIFKRLP